MRDRRRYAGLPFIVIGLSMFTIGLGTDHAKAFIPVGVVFIAIGAAFTARQRRAAAAAPADPAASPDKPQ